MGSSNRRRLWRLTSGRRSLNRSLPDGVRLEDARAGAITLLRFYHVPSYLSARPGEAESLEILARVVGGDDSCRLYRELVAKNLASAAGSDYIGNAVDSGRMACVIGRLAGIPPEQVEAVLDKTIADIGDKGVTQDELDRAKS